jgi:hypothetical protein
MFTTSRRGGDDGMELTLHLTGKCQGSCNRYLVERELWKTLPLQFREQVSPVFAQNRSRNLCPTCWSRLHRSGRLETMPRLQLAKGEFVDEYLSMKSYGESDYSIRQTLGMSKAAFEKALERAKKAGKIK